MMHDFNNCIIQLFHTFLCNSQNYHPRGAVDDPMHCCMRPKASDNSASGHPQHLVGDSFDCCTESSASGNSASGHPQHLVGDSFDCCTERYEIVVLLPNSEDTCYYTPGIYAEGYIVFVFPFIFGP